MPGLESRQRRVVDVLKRRIREDAPRIGANIGPPSGVVKRSSAQERLDYWTKDPSVVRDPETYWRQALEAAAASAQPDEPDEEALGRARLLFAHALYPARLNLIRSGHRGLDVDEQIRFADEQEKLGPPGGEEAVSYA